MDETYAARLSTALHAELNRLAAKLGDMPERPLTTEDLRETLLSLAEALPAPE